MKTVKRALALVLALTLLLAMSATVFAADDTTYTITINNKTTGHTYANRPAGDPAGRFVIVPSNVVEPLSERQKLKSSL